MFETVVVGADDSSTARQAVEVAADVARMSGGALHIVTAYEAKSVHRDDLPKEFRDVSAITSDADALLQVLSFVAEERGLRPVVHTASGNPADAVVRVAERECADLIVVGNKGMKGARRVLGSIPNSIAHGAPCSVLIVDTQSDH